MKYLKLLSLLCALFLGSCCSNKDTCSILSFKEIKMVGFSKEEMRDTINLTVFDGRTGFVQAIQVISPAPISTEDSVTFIIETADLDIQNNYQVEVVHSAKKYKISNFNVEKVACGKCFMRANNNFGYRLNAYSVNGRGQAYDGQVFISK
jgi:hypothetical protein